MARSAAAAPPGSEALPLKLSLLIGLVMTTVGFGYSGFVLYEHLVLGTTVRGWSSLVCFQLIFSGTTLTAVGLVGDYVALIYEEAKRRPLYVVGETLNFDPSAALIPRGLRLLPRDERERRSLNGTNRKHGGPTGPSSSAVDRPLGGSLR